VIDFGATPLKLAARAVKKPWGRIDLPLFPNPDGQRIGEIWFEGPVGDRLPLLVKYIFTSEPLSIQVHPNDAQASPYGLTSGKEECWYILDREPGARLGIGLIAALSEHDMREAIADGTIEQWIDWKAVEPGDFFFIPAGTVHAIGAGITLVEVQQNADITFRLYDYGRPRALHLEQGLEVSRLGPYERDPIHAELGETRTLLAEGCAPFELEIISWIAGQKIGLRSPVPCWFVPLAGDGSIGGETFRRGECWLTDRSIEIVGRSAGTALVAFPKPAVSA
jgi:mannose-6-phosphate isomerase